MSKYTPDKWKIITSKYGSKVLSGWNGGYTTNDNWRMSSGIIKIDENEEYYIIYNHSGSEYTCYKNKEGFTRLSLNVFNKLTNLYKGIRDITVEQFNKTKDIK